jgi:CRP/FNR family transcriptional regulator
MPIESQILKQTFPIFDQSELIEWLVQHCSCMDFAADSEIMHVNGIIRHIPLLISGSVKVSREDAEGREIFLYYILPGETCAMTLSACYKGEKSRINAATLEPSTIALLPAHLIHDVTRRYPAWQRFAFESFGSRYDELLHTLESVVFQQLDERLRQYLLEKSAALQTKVLHISQQQIADDLHASREIISRLIRQFEQKGLLRHSRGSIEIFDKV